MQSNNQQKKAFILRNQEHICPKCGFQNHNSAVYCEICFYPLSINEPNTNKSLATKPPVVKPPQVNVPKYSANDFKQELQKPSVLSGLAVLGIAIALWANYFISRRPTYITSSQGDSLALYDTMSQVPDVPDGLFSYGGALYFASLVAHGMNDAMLWVHPNFDLRYTKPTNNDRSYSNGIKMLLDGELSFAFNGRPLVNREYSQARLRDMKLQQVPIAIDGIVIFGNNQIPTKGLSLDQVRDIFTGKITNWKQLGDQDLPITPVLLSPEDIELLGLDNTANIPSTTKYVSNYTLALRKVIATPGTISFASSSLVQNQQLLKVFGLAEENSRNYISPMVAGKPNLKVFKSGNYPLTRRLFLVIRQDGTPDQLAGKAYAQMLLSREGQAIVRKAGLVPLYGE